MRSYQINARTELALRYNDVSPLENHHCAIAFKILSNPDLNIFANVGDSFRHIRSVINVSFLLLFRISPFTFGGLRGVSGRGSFYFTVGQFTELG